MQVFQLQAFGDVTVQANDAAGLRCGHLHGAQARFFPAFAHEGLQRALAVGHAAADEVVVQAGVGGLVR